MHNTNAKIVRAIPVTNDNRTTGTELNRNNFILLRGAKSSENGGHILLRTDHLTKNGGGLVLDDGDGKLGQIFIQQNDVTKGVLVQSVKRLGAGTPILLLSGHEGGNGHILIQAGPADEIQTVGDIEEPNDILVQALEGLNEGDASSSRSLSTPIGSDSFGADKSSPGKRRERRLCSVGDHGLIARGLPGVEGGKFGNGPPNAAAGREDGGDYRSR
ncbi:unnamed protein product [Brassicogethes aeneus]|uniref:Uncharacterized protein n=1 Tax=Brassicogethes aeneus TaxID=1431903 RepID=A0A9P0FIT9_BRAAE|nr:unnamed protein product [Brassicogethes aeneus]